MRHSLLRPIPLICALVGLAAASAHAADGAADRIAAGKAVYERPGLCITCHQPTGAGIPPAFPPLAGSAWVVGDEAAPIHIVLGGLSGEIKVGEVTYNSLMPGLGAQLSDAEIADVLTYVRSEWGNKAAPVAVGTVTKLRAEQKARGDAMWTAAELQKH